ncbi:MAG: hypothetical protein SPK09_05160 [Porphyromonas sp.]|nr:hypothetical protein [Porphyromonas sp.]
MQEFDANFSELIQEALHIAFEYTDYSGEIEGIYIYISLELGGMYLVFYRINGHLSMHHRLNEYSSNVYDVSDNNQDWLNSSGNELAEQIRQCFIDDEREVPKYLKMVYEPLTGKFDCKIGYEPLLDLDNMVGELTVFFRWFAEEGGELEAWQKNELKKG